LLPVNKRRARQIIPGEVQKNEKTHRHQSEALATIQGKRGEYQKTANYTAQHRKNQTKEIKEMR